MADSRGSVVFVAAPGLKIEEFLGRDPTDSLEHLFDGRPTSFLRSVPGRETFASSDLPGALSGQIVKRFTGGSAGEAWFERLHGRPVCTPAQREFDALRELSELGIPVARPILWAQRPACGDRFDSLVVMAEVPHSCTLRSRLEADDAACFVASPAAREFEAALLEIVAGIHRAGWYHRDLYLEHFILPVGDRDRGPDRSVAQIPVPMLVLLDAGRCRREAAPRRRWFEKDLAALLHSCPNSVSSHRRLRFLIRYLAAVGVTTGDASRARRNRSNRQRAIRRWMRAIESRRRKMERHTPRFGERSAGP